MSNEKDIYKLDLHEFTRVNLGDNPELNKFGIDGDWEVTVLKVPNGWIYIGLDDKGSVFVPSH